LLGRLVADVARLLAQVADLRSDWPADPPHLIIVDDRQVN
jgi:hypothetical protein